MKSENVKERPLTKLDEYAILISKHWKRSKTGADSCDPTSILVDFKEDIKEVIENELISDGWTKTIWHKVADGDLPKDYEHLFLTVNDKGYYEVANFDKNGDFWVYDDYCHKYVLSGIIAWTELPEYKEK